MSKLSCGCTPDASGFGYCEKCTRTLRAKIWKSMSEKEKAYDGHFSPAASRALDEAEEYGDQCGCSCHIDPPCSYCLSKDDDDEDI